MLDLMHHVEALSREIGPRRPAGSSAEQQAATYVAAQARRYAFHVWVDPVRVTGRPWLGIFLLGAAALVGLALLPWSLWLGLGFLLAVCAVWGLQYFGRLKLDRLGTERTTQNVVGVIPARLELRNRLVVVAPTDTPAQSDAGAGADPGAGAMAVALGLGRFLRRAPLHYTEVWTVFAGGQHAGDKGLRALLDLHGRPLADASIILLDAVGGGSLRYLASDGGITQPPVNLELLEMVRGVAGTRPALGIRAVSGASLGQWSLGLADRRRGLRAVSMRSESPEVDPVTLNTAWRFLYELAERMDRQAQVDVVAERVLAESEDTE